jgi:phosphoribosylformylglycinamidine (FGAM) synthase-like enzyme
MTESKITPEVVAEHGLSPEEYERVLHAMGREPNLTELGHLLGDVVGALLLQKLART